MISIIIFLIGCYLYLEILHFSVNNIFLIQLTHDFTLDMTIMEIYQNIIGMILLICFSPVWYVVLTYRWIVKTK